MRYLIHISLLVVMISALTFAQEDAVLSKKEWQAQIAELTAKKTVLKAKLDSLQAIVADLQKQDAEKTQALNQCHDELSAVQGELEAPFLAKLDAIDARLNELSALSNEDLWARKAELDTVQKWIKAAQKDPLSVIQKYQNRLNDQQSRLDALKQKLAEMSGSASIYTVGTWSRDRDCLWNIAKKPKIYDNAFLWPKIWQGNRDQIKDPDIIHPGQKLKIPPKADLTKEETRALRSYWAKKRGN
jgi:nucleoid-associated protein YgaU